MRLDRGFLLSRPHSKKGIMIDMSLTIFRHTLRHNYKFLLIFGGVLGFYLFMIISLIDPADMKQVQELFGSMESYMDAFGISIGDMTTPLRYTASVFFSLLVMAFTMVFYVIQSTRLIAKPVEDTSLSYLLSTPVTRTKLVVTKALYLIFSMAVLFLVILGVGSLCLMSFEDFPLDFGAYLNLVGITFFLCTAIAMLSFFLSVAFCSTKLGIWLATGVPIALLFLSMLGGVGGEKTQWLQKVTPFGWLDGVGIVSGTVDTGWMYLALAGAIIVLFAASVVVFGRKRLPI